MEKEAGFTLAEVLAALVITGLALTFATNILNWQVNLAKRGGEIIEAQQAVKTSLLYVEREIRSAKSVSLQAPGVLSIIRNNGQSIKFYVDDKDNNGIKDLYQEINGIATPLVSYVIEANFQEQGVGNWQVTFIAKEGGEESRCQFMVRKRSD